MLTAEENQWNFQYLKILSRLNILAIQTLINGEKEKEPSQICFVHRKNGLKLWIWRFFYGLAIFHWLYIFGRLVESIFQPKYLDGQRYFRWDHFILHFMLSVGYLTSYVCGYLLVLAHPTDVIITLNYVFSQNKTDVEDDAEPDKDEKYQSQNQNGDADEESTPVSTSKSASILKENDEHNGEKMVLEGQNSVKSKIRPIFTWPLLYSLQELWARTFSFVIVGTGVFILIVLGVDPGRPQLLYTVIPDHFKNWSTYLILLGLEGFMFLVATSSGYIFLITQLQFLDNFEVKCQRIHSRLRSLNRSPGTVNPRPTSAEIFSKRENPNPTPNQNLTLNQPLRQILKDMKELELCVEIFNRCFPFCIFSFKMVCLVIAIFGCFFTIRKFAEHPLLAAFSGYTALLVSLLYTITYEKAFAVPENMERLKNSFLLAAGSESKSKSKPTAKATATATPFSSINLNNNSQVPAFSLWSEFKREVTRIRNGGIKVGGFHHMERMSTLNFIDFVLRNVVNLLVLSKR